MTDTGASPSDIDLERARVVVAGLGVSGRAVAAALADRARAITTVDAAAPDADLDDTGEIDLAAVDLVVASPGWPPSHPFLAEAARRGIAVWSEVELAWRLRVARPDGTYAPWLAVTGTNGKTTTVQMLVSILAAAGLRSAAVGNVGTPVIDAACDPTFDVLAVELSSFQLHSTYTLAAEAAAVLNIAPDHLDWHGGMEAYAQDKGRIYERVRRSCVYAVADPRTEALVRSADVAQGAVATGFTLGAPGPGQLGVVDGILVDRAFHAPEGSPDRHRSAVELGTLDDLAHLTGPGQQVPQHVVANALAAAALARAHGVPTGAVRDGLRAFRPGDHRGDHVARIDEVSYIDDSKATNAHAAGAALRSLDPGSVVWIAGGLAKGSTFDDLVAEQGDRLRAAVLIGTDRTELARALARHAPQVPVDLIDPQDTGTVMNRAVVAAHAVAMPGDTVLLAPACASMDQFRNYADRGDAFVAAVRLLGS